MHGILLNPRDIFKRCAQRGAAVNSFTEIADDVTIGCVSHGASELSNDDFENPIFDEFMESPKFRI